MSQPTTERMNMDEEARKAREFTALELIAAELEQLRMLKRLV